jgi:hypothetical protein
MEGVRLTLAEFNLTVEGQQLTVPHSAERGVACQMRSAWVVVRASQTCRSSLARAWMAAPSWRLISISMRTEHAGQQSCCCPMFLHVNGFQPGTVTTSDRS